LNGPGYRAGATKLSVENASESWQKGRKKGGKGAPIQPIVGAAFLTKGGGCGEKIGWSNWKAERETRGRIEKTCGQGGHKHNRKPKDLIFLKICLKAAGRQTTDKKNDMPAEKT